MDSGPLILAALFSLPLLALQSRKSGNGNGNGNGTEKRKREGVGGRCRAGLKDENTPVLVL